jgi:hypothetical protein
MRVDRRRVRGHHARRMRSRDLSENHGTRGPSDLRGALVLFTTYAAFTVGVGLGCVVPISSAVPNPTSTGGSTGSTPGLGSAQAPTGTWTNVTNNLAGLQSECGTSTMVIPKPDEDLLIAGIATQGLWGSRNGGGSWQQMGTGAGSTAITNRPSWLVFDPTDSTRFWEAGIYGTTGGVFETQDDGLTFTQLGSVHDDDAVSVDLANEGTLLAGGHEMWQTLFLSQDDGMTWNNVGSALPNKTNCTQPLIIDAVTYLVGCGGYGGGPSGVYRSTDSGVTWAVATTSGGAGAPLRATSDQSLYWASPGNEGMARSPDNGQTWTEVVGPNVILSYHPVELPDGRIAALGSQYVMLSADHGVTWNPASSALPYSDAVGVAYSGPRKAFYIWHFACGPAAVPVQTDAIMSFAFDYEAK